MIIKEQESNTTIVGEVESNKVGISNDNIEHLMSLLTTNLYSDPEGSFIRETVSNAWDSHVEAVNTDPIIVQLDYNPVEDNYFCVVKDQGVGISSERFDKIYRNLGSSTKRQSNNEIGGFGIGRMSALAVSNSVSITSCHESTMYKYLMYKDGDKIQIDLVYESETTEANGVEVKLELSREQATSIYDYILENFTFFENLYLVSNVFDSNVFNNNKIRNFGLFSVSSYRSRKLSNSYVTNSISVLNGKILYPLDSSFFNIPNILRDKDININLEIGELSVTPNRENIIYTEKTKELLQNKLYDIAVYVESFTEKYRQLKTFTEVLDYFINKCIYIPIMEDVEWESSSFPYYKGMDCHTSYERVLSRLMHESNIYENKGDKIKIINYVNFRHLRKCFYRGDYSSLKANHKAFVREKYFDNIINLKVNSRLLKYLLKTEGNQIKPIIRQILEYYNSLPDISTLEPTKEWLEAKKTSRKKVLRSTDLLCYTSSLKYAYSSNVETIKESFKNLNKTLNIVIEKSRAEEMYLYVLMFSKHRNLKFTAIADTKLKKVKEYNNIKTMHFDDFKNKHNKHLMRVATATYLKQEVLSKRINDDFFNVVKPSCLKGFSTIKMYIDKYKCNTNNVSVIALLESMVALYKENNAFDPAIMHYYNKNKNNFKYGYIYSSMCENKDMEPYFLDLVFLKKEFIPNYKYVNKIKNENT